MPEFAVSLSFPTPPVLLHCPPTSCSIFLLRTSGFRLQTSYFILSYLFLRRALQHLPSAISAFNLLLTTTSYPRYNLSSISLNSGSAILSIPPSYPNQRLLFALPPPSPLPMMNLPPQSMRSPMSAFDHQQKQAFSSQRHCYPATPQPGTTSMEQANRGLGIFECPLPQPQQSTVSTLPPSPQTSDSWSHSSMMEQNYPQTSQPPDIFSAAFDPFSGYSTNANTGMVSTQSPEAPGLVFCQSPPSTSIPSHRSSISSSYSSPDAFPHGVEYYTPKVKMEDSNEWYPSPGNEQVLQRSLTTQGISNYSNGMSPINAPSEDFYKTQPGEWCKSSVLGYTDMNMLGEDARSKFDAAPVLPSVNRIKKKRQRTTPAEATHKCRVCGKLFKRSYNWKSHMETHNPERKYPHPCTAMVGNALCTKRFQRKTDLDRHYDSVSFEPIYHCSRDASNQSYRYI